MASKKQRELNIDPLLKDILVENVDPDKFIFKKFKDRKDIMKNILDEFTSGRYSNSEEDENYTGYFISENDRDEVGVLSYALTISTFVSLLSQGELVKEVRRGRKRTHRQSVRRRRVRRGVRFVRAYKKLFG